MLTDGLPERGIVRHAGLVERLHVELDKAGPLQLADLQAPMHLDQMGKAELSRETVRTTERLGGECGEVVHVLGPAGPEEWVLEGVGQDAGIERVFEVMQWLFSAGVLIEGRHEGM